MMLRSLNQLYGEKLGTADGAVGHVEDFYFDDRQWAVRYVVADTGSWLPGRLVLISPYAFGDLFQDGDSLLVNLSREEIENSPGIESHKSVSRQYEEDYYRHYGWPAYWDGVEMWGATGFPTAPAPDLVPIRDERHGIHLPNADDPHLRDGNSLLTDLSGQQIENGLESEFHQPVSRQYQEDHYRHDGPPAYRDADEMRGATGFPIAPAPDLVPTGDDDHGSHLPNGDDPHLQSAKAVVCYHVETDEGRIGQITDFIMDDRSWAIRHLVVETGHWFPGKEIAISPTKITSISYDDSTVFVNATKAAIQDAPEYRVPQLGDTHHTSGNANL